MSRQQYPNLMPEPGRSGPPLPPMPPGPPPAAPPARPTGTNVMAVLAVVFAVLFAPLGIVFGLVGRRQTARTGQPGRGLATTGLVLSVVFLLLGVAAAVAVTVFAGQVLRAVPSTPAAPELPGLSVPAVTGPVGPGTAVVADGDYGPELPADALAAEVGARSGASDVICPGYLPAQVAASSTCDGILDAQAARFRATVTVVSGADATIDIVREQ